MKNMKAQSQAGFLMAKIRQVGNRIFEQLRKESGIELNSAQGRIMFALWEEDGIAIKELGKRTQLKKSTLTHMLDRLEEMGYVKRERSKEDRRKIIIKRTEKDKALENKYVKLSEKMTNLFYRGFTGSEVEHFERHLGRILKNLMKYEEGMKKKG
jgi:DNA-binding MarR family transcriptional regulator